MPQTMKKGDTDCCAGPPAARAPRQSTMLPKAASDTQLGPWAGLQALKLPHLPMTLRRSGQRSGRRRSSQRASLGLGIVSGLNVLRTSKHVFFYHRQTAHSAQECQPAQFPRPGETPAGAAHQPLPRRCGREAGHLGRSAGSAPHSGCCRPLLMPWSTSASCAAPPAARRRASRCGKAGWRRRLPHSGPRYQSLTKGPTPPDRSTSASRPSLAARSALASAPAPPPDSPPSLPCGPLR